MMRILESTRWRKKARTCDLRSRKRLLRPFVRAQNENAASTSFGLKLLDRFQENVASDGQGFGADFVERILRSVPVTVIHEVADDVHGGNAALQEGIMVVLGGC